MERAEALVSPATTNISRHASVTKQETCDTNNNYEALNRSVIEDDNEESSCINKSPSTFDLFAVDKKIVKTNKDPDEQLEEKTPTNVNKNSRKKEELDFLSCEDDGDDGMSFKKVNIVFSSSLNHVCYPLFWSIFICDFSFMLRSFLREPFP